MTSLESPAQGHVSPAHAQTSDSSTHPRHSTAPNAQGPKPQEQARGSSAPECRASPSGTTSTAPNVASRNLAAVLLSPAPSEEETSPVVVSDSPAETEAPALEPTSADTEAARFSPVPLADTPAKPPTPAEARQGTGMAAGEGDNSNRQAAVSPRYQQWLDELYRYIATRAGDLQPLEKDRIQYLRDALVVGDEFCVIVHEFLVLWRVNAEKCAELLRLPQPILHAACMVFENALGSTRPFRSEVVEWMVNFPFSLRSEGCVSTIAMDVAKFFRRLAIKWDNLTYFVRNFKIPLRHRELLGVLNLRSQTLRLTLFHWSRWFLGVESTRENLNVILALDEKFKEDQDFYLDTGNGEEEFREHDARLADEYRAIVRAAHIGGRELQEIAARSASGTSASAQGQQVRSPVQQGLSVPQEYSRKRSRAEADEQGEQDGQARQARQAQQYAHLQRLQQLAPELQAQNPQVQQVQQVRQVQRVPPRRAQQGRQEHHSRPRQGQQEQQGQNPRAQQGHPQGSLFTQQQGKIQQIHAQMMANQSLAMGRLQGPLQTPLQLPQQEIPHHAQPQFQANPGWQQQQRQQRQQQQAHHMMMQGQHQLTQRELQLLQHVNTQSYLQQQQQQRLAHANQQSQQQNSYPHVGSWPSSPTHAAPYSPTGQTQAGQAMALTAGIQQLHVQSQTPAAVRMGQGIATANGAFMLSHRPVHGGGTVVINSNLATPTANSPVSHHPSVEQHTRLGSAASPVQPTPIQPQPQPRGVINTRFAPHNWSAAAAQNSPSGPAPTQAFPSPSSRPQSTAPTDTVQTHKDSLHQYIDKLLVGPTRLPTNAARVKFEFDITEPDFKMLSPMNSQGGRFMVSIFEGCRRVRFRICTRTVTESEGDAPILESEWVAAPVVWPGTVTVKVNDNGFVDVPRKRVFGHDMPCEISPFLKEGRNLVSVVVPSGAPSNQEFFGAIELVDTVTHEGIIERTVAQRCMPETETVALIKNRLAVEDDDIQVLDPTINISVADPISTGLVEVPCRGAACRHVDAFDLRAMLESRLPKRCPHGVPSASCAECASRPHGWRRTGPADGWRCPICGGDVRPGHLVVDGFLKGVVEKMKAEKSAARAITVDVEGVWRVKAEDKAEKEREVIMIDD